MRFENHTLILQDFGFYILKVFKKGALIDLETAKQISITKKQFEILECRDYILVIDESVKFTFLSIDFFGRTEEMNQIDCLAIVDERLNEKMCCKINWLISFFYLRDKVKLKVFINRKNAEIWIQAINMGKHQKDI